MKAMLDIVRRHRGGESTGIYSVCSAHPLVIEATLREARDAGAVALIEATSNQVNQEGGYTGMRPTGFRDLVHGLADAADLSRTQVLLGGDHLGPNCWQGLPAAEALGKAGVMVADYVTAGFRKIHLDCSMSCSDDPPALGDELIAERAAELCTLTEAAWQQAGGEPPVYIVGSEVPVPGGAHEALTELAVTRPEAAQATLEAHRRAFARRGLAAAWERVVGLVVQPGVEFDHDRVIDYQPARAQALSQCLSGVPGMVFEAHSTDYQTPAALAALVRDHFAILKVGPGVTFALREAIWALDQIEREWRGENAAVDVRNTVLRAMCIDPRHWQRYYDATGAALQLQQQYSLSDRIRYYWPVPVVDAAVRRLYASLDANPPPAALVSQYLPQAYAALRRRALKWVARDLVAHHIRTVLDGYARACGQPGR
jgi:D-tagatose-1,6-bisphosphate aldolase subunit GatZ/KbaZ